MKFVTLIIISLVTVFFFFLLTPYKLRQIQSTTSSFPKLLDKKLLLPPLTPKKPKCRKVVYERCSFTYDYDQNDTFYYDVLKSQSQAKLLPVIIQPFMNGHSQSQCIRRLAIALSRSGHDVYVLLQRGSMGVPFGAKQKKFRNLGLDYEDTEKLIQIIGSEVQIVGYSLGAIRLCHFLASDSSMLQFVRKAMLGYIEFDPMEATRFPQKVQLQLGGANVKQYNELNREYLVFHGFTQQDFEDMEKCPTMLFWDEVNWVRHGLKCKDVIDYYHVIDVRPLIKNIKTDTLIFQNADDRITGKFLPLEDIETNHHLCAVVSNKGNHLGGLLKNGSDVPSMIAREWFD